MASSLSSPPLIETAAKEEDTAATATDVQEADRHDDEEPYRLHLFQTLQESRREASSLPPGNEDDDPTYYASYHRYCTAKISRIVHRKSVRNLLVHSHKYQTAAEAAAMLSAAAAAASEESPSAAASATGVDSPPPPPPHKNKNKASKTKKKHAYCPRDLTVVGHHHVDFLWHLAYQSERAWSHACEIQRGTSTTGAGGSFRKMDGTSAAARDNHQHAIRRFKKAAMWSQRLAQAAQLRCDDVSVRECQSYASYMAGNVALEQRKFRDALDHYRRSRSILIELVTSSALSSTSFTVEEGTATATASDATSARSGKGSDDADNLARRDVWTTRADSLLQPLIRYCEYESRTTEEVAAAGSQDDSTHAPALSSSRSNDPSSAVVRGEILLTFRGRTVALDSYQELAVLYLKLQQRLVRSDGDGNNASAAATDTALSSSSSSSGWDEDSFLALSNDLDAALRIVQSETKRYEKLPDGPAVASKRADLAAIRQYLEYQKLSGWRRQQERRLATATVAPTGGASESDLLYLYDTLLQNAVATSELQQQQQQDSSGSSYNALDDPLWLETQAHVLRFRAYRCYYLARYHEENHDDDSAANGIVRAGALFRQADKLAARAIEEADACDNMESHVTSLQELAVQIRASLCRVEALRWLEESGAHAVVSTRRPLWMRLNDWDHGAGSHVVGPGRPDVPPKVVVFADNPPLPMPVPCKPSFYDVAWQHLPRDDDVARDIGSFIAAHEPKRGFLDWVRGGLK